MKCIIFTLLLSLLINPSIACNLDGTGGIVEENDINIPVDALRVGGLTEAQFNAVIEKTEAIYAPVVTNLGATLVVNRKWTDGTANANASRLVDRLKSSVLFRNGVLASHERWYY